MLVLNHFVGSGYIQNNVFFDETVKKHSIPTEYREIIISYKFDHLLVINRFPLKFYSGDDIIKFKIVYVYIVNVEYAFLRLLGLPLRNVKGKAFKKIPNSDNYLFKEMNKKGNMKNDISNN